MMSFFKKYNKFSKKKKIKHEKLKRKDYKYDFLYQLTIILKT